MANAKLTEGEKHIRNAEKYMKTSLLKWKPDLDEAISEYELAVTAFRNAKAFRKAIDACCKASELHKSNKNVFHAAKQLEQAAILSKDCNDVDSACRYMDTSSQYYLQSGSPEQAAISLDKAGRMLEKLEPLRAAPMYQRSAEIYEGEQRLRQSSTALIQAAKLYVRSEKWQGAIDVLNKQYEVFTELHDADNQFKVVVHLVLIHLQMDDLVAAKRVYNFGSGLSEWALSLEGQALGQLLDAWESGDQDTLDSVSKAQLFTYLDNDYVKLARSLRAPEIAAGIHRVAPSTGVNVEQMDDDDDDEGFDGSLL